MGKIVKASDDTGVVWIGLDHLRPSGLDLRIGPRGPTGRLIYLTVRDAHKLGEALLAKAKKAEDNSNELDPPLSDKDDPLKDDPADPSPPPSPRPPRRLVRS